MRKGNDLAEVVKKLAKGSTYVGLRKEADRVKVTEMATGDKHVA